MAPPSHTDPARTVLVDDHALVRRGLRQLFEREPDFTVCGDAATETEAFDLVEALAPDLLVTDMTLEGRSGLDLIQRVHRYHPALPVLVVSMHEEDLYAHRAFAAGARGYVMKRSADGEVLRAARAVRDGSVYTGGTVRSDPGPELRLGNGRDPLAALTDREFEVFLLVGRGFTPRYIAEQLALSVSTVEVYRERLKEKLDLASSPLLLRYAVRWCKDQNEI